MRVMSAGDGYKYLLKSVVAGDGSRALSTPLTRYYAETGTPPGFWLGEGVRSLGQGELAPGNVVSEAQLRYRRAARYDDPVRVRTWVRGVASRRIDFGYAVEHAERGELLLTASTALLVLNAEFAFARLPEEIAARLRPISDPVRL